MLKLKLNHLEYFDCYLILRIEYYITQGWSKKNWNLFFKVNCWYIDDSWAIIYNLNRKLDSNRLIFLSKYVNFTKMFISVLVIILNAIIASVKNSHLFVSKSRTGNSIILKLVRVIIFFRIFHNFNDSF